MTAVSTTGTALRPRSRLRARLVLAGLSACGLAALAWASFVHPIPSLIYNPSDSVPVGWYRVDPLGHGTGSPPRPLSVGSIVLVSLPAEAAALAAQRGYLPARVPLLKRVGGRLRIPRDAMEAEFVDEDATVSTLFPQGLPRVILTHTRPEPMLGILRRIDNGPTRTHALGYISRGGTFDVPGMLFANRCTWAHTVDAAATVAGWNREALLDPAQRAALDGTGDPKDLLSP